MLATRMTVVLATFAALAMLLGWLFPHDVHRLGYKMGVIYALFAAGTALLGILRRAG